jgi:hypothetical protein
MRPKPFSEKQLDVLKGRSKRLEALRYGQDITLTDNGLDINYYIFPKLLNDNHFFSFKLHKKITIYNLPSRYVDEIEKINTEILTDGDFFKIYTNYNNSTNMNLIIDYINHINDLENIVYICWLNLFALSFWYCESIEKQFRFFQLMSVIKSTNYIDVIYV